MQRIPNFGSLLQSYSLMKILKEMGHEVSFIDIEKNEQDDILMNGCKVDFADECNYSYTLLDKIKKIDRYALNRLLLRIKADKQNKMFSQFATNELKLNNKSNDDKYDLCIIGSDEVFNCKSNSEWGFTTQLFGNVKQANKVITYAASSGATTFSDLPDLVVEKIINSFRNISAFSVRDNNTYSFVTKLTQRQVDKNFDPVLLGDFESEINACIEKIKMPKRYCLIYSYYNRINKKEDIAEIKKFCKRNKLTLVAVGAPQMWIKRYYCLHPFEVLAVFAKADFVITDTFHGTIFASRFSTKFAAAVCKSNHNKLQDLINSLDLQKHLINSYSQLSETLIIDKEKNKFEELIRLEKKRTVDYLKKYIV